MYSFLLMFLSHFFLFILCASAMGENGKAFAGRLCYLKDSATLRKSEFMWILRFLMYVFLASSFLAANKQASRSAKIAAVFSFRTYHILPCAYGKQNQKNQPIPQALVFLPTKNGDLHSENRRLNFGGPGGD